jgi:hypothetical protein
VFVDVILVNAVLYIINFANCYQNGPIKARKEAKEGREGKEKLLVFLVNCAHYATLFYYEVSEPIIGISIISYGQNSLDLRPT